MQKIIDSSYFDWSKDRKPAIISKGLAALVMNQIKSTGGNTQQSKAHCIWPSGLNNVDSRYLTRRVWSR
ncbi:MAG: hypothetical protein IKL33_00970 [Alphaproteobacteria bacterium]|jgi:hypothetical protein|nr:hypothetical protein [Alphaproteobacteria bacterium]